jgi:hypothetical protein
MAKRKWDIRGQGRSWNKDECWQRFELLPERFEMIRGELLLSNKDRENLLGVVLELVGADRAVEFGDPEVWRAAVAKLPS